MTLCSDSTAVTALWPENYDFDSDGQKNGATGFSVFHWTVLLSESVSAANYQICNGINL